MIAKTTAITRSRRARYLQKRESTCNIIQMMHDGQCDILI